MRMVFSRKTAGVSGFLQSGKFRIVLLHSDFDKIYDKFFEDEDVEIDFTETAEAETEEELKESLRGMEKESTAYATGRLPKTLSYSQKVVDAVSREMGLSCER